MLKNGKSLNVKHDLLMKCDRTLKIKNERLMSTAININLYVEPVVEIMGNHYYLTARIKNVTRK